MSFKHQLRTLIVCLPLALGLLMGVPMKPEEIEQLMHDLNQPRIAVTIPGESENGGGSEDPEEETADWRSAGSAEGRED